jgi:hypothetical protein
MNMGCVIFGHLRVLCSSSTSMKFALVKAETEAEPKGVKRNRLQSRYRYFGSASQHSPLVKSKASMIL